MNLTGDILVSSGMVAYLGPFTAAFRSEIMAKWMIECKDREIPSSAELSVQHTLGNPVEIRSWGLQGLPVDSFSIENAIIMKNGRRWTLFIDP